MGCLYTGNKSRAFLCWCLRHCSRFLPGFPHPCRDQCYPPMLLIILGGFLSPFIQCTHISSPTPRLIFPLAVFLLSVLHLGRFPGGLSSPALQIPPCALWPSPGEAQGEAGCRQPANAALFMRAACWCRLQSGGSWESLSGMKH